MAAGAEPGLQILGREDVAPEDVPPIDLAPAPEDDAHMLLLKRAAGFGEVRCVAPVLHPTLARFVVNASDGEKMYERLDEALRLLDVCNVEHWLCAGTLLGQCRHGGIIPWDDDARSPAPLFPAPRGRAPRAGRPRRGPPRRAAARRGAGGAPARRGLGLRADVLRLQDVEGRPVRSVDAPSLHTERVGGPSSTC